MSQFNTASCFAYRPRRTRTSSGSIVRIFRGEFVGTVGGSLSSQGLDRRVLIKEFSDNDLALSLVKSELQSIGRLQSNLMFPSMDEAAKMNGIEWIRIAMARRSLELRKDSANVVSLMKALANAPFVGILGKLSPNWLCMFRCMIDLCEENLPFKCFFVDRRGKLVRVGWEHGTQRVLSRHGCYCAATWSSLGRL